MSNANDGTGRTFPSDGPDRRTVENETLRLASMQYSIETQARIETLLWILGYIDDQKCPSGSANDKRVRELTSRGSWPFDPNLGDSHADK